MIFYTIDNKDVKIKYTVSLPDHVVDKVNSGDIDTMRNIAKMLVSKIEEHPDKGGKYYRTTEGSKFYFDINDPDKAMTEIMRDFLLHGEYEPHTTEIVKREVKEGDVCVDVGASIGYFTMLFAQRVGLSGKVYSFEPTQNQFKYVRENIKANNYQMQVIAENMGAWSSETEIKLKVNAGNEQICKVMPVDLILPRKVDFIKIDVDGAEPEVLKGLEETIKNNPQLKLIIEYYPKYIEMMGLNPKDVISFLDKYFTYSRIEGEFSDDYFNFYCVRKN